MKHVRKISMMIVTMMLAPLFTGITTTVVRAEEPEYSISSPESTVYVSDVRADERRQLFNDNWKFNLGDQSNGEANSFDDSSWEDVQLPHDYSLSQDYTTQGEAESGYKLGGIGWYRKSFTMDTIPADKRVKIEFGAVYMNATVYINGHKLGDHPNGYTPFAYDITDYIDFEGENVLAVRVNHKFPSSRWYSGSGIYRNVHLTVTDEVHVDHYGVTVTSPNLETQVGADVDVNVQTTVKNESASEAVTDVKQSIRKKGTEEVLATATKAIGTLASGATETVEETLVINNPDLWSVENPHLYEVITEVLVDDESVDKVVTDYGFRIFEFDADEGFYLNGEAMKLQGVSMHSDQGSLGSAAHYRAMERQVEILKDMGVNAIRVTHNPAADEFLEIANNKGMLVIDEAFDTWVDYKNGNRFDYAEWFDKKVGDNPLLGAEPDMTWAEFDIKTMVRRGINAPSIMSWSIGNEVMEGNSGPYGHYPEIAEKLVRWVGEEDTTRPSTIGENKLKANWKEGKAIAQKIADADGLVGFNYADGGHFDDYHKNYPEWKMYGAETASSVNSRGVYNTANYGRHLTSYDESRVGWGKFSADSWYSIITRDFMAGEFVWTGFDYLGEPTPWNNIGSGATGQWPSPKSSYFGIVDTAGLPKDRFYFYQSQWNKDVNTLHVLPAWKEEMVVKDDDGNVRVDVYSDASSVELVFEDTEGNETSLGTKEFTKYTTDVGHTYQMYEGEDKKSEDFRNLYLTWQVPYEDGTVRAIGYDENGNEITDTVGRDYVTTFGEATTMSLEADSTEITADGFDLSYITIDVLDNDGNIVEDASNLMNVNVTGDGELIALDNGNQLDHEPYDSGKREAFSGKLVAIVRSTKDAGSMTVNVESAGLESQSIEIVTKPDPNASEEKRVVSYTMPRSYYVKLGHQPGLAENTSVRYSDGTEETLPINWTIDESTFNEVGTHKITGIVEAIDLPVTTNVIVVEGVGALLNYSTVVRTGVNSVNLPSTRPIVLENGEVLTAEFPVEWEAQNSADYQEEGIVTVNGSATIFGQDFTVTSTIRVSDADVSLGSNVAGNNLTLTQSIPKEFQSDSLEAIVNGDRGFEAIGEGELANETVWTNYNMAQTGDNKAEIVFTFATAQYLGAADLYFYQDSWAARLPENVEFYWSNEGTEDAEWTKLDHEEELVESSDPRPNVSKGHYRFNGVSAIGFKIVLTSQEGTNSAGKNLAVGLSEVELLVEESTLETNSASALDQITLNGKEVSQFQLDQKEIQTRLKDPKIEAITENNVAVTILDAQDDIIRIITESEDNQNRDVYTIKVNQTNIVLPPEDDSRDYPYGKTTATAGAHHPNHPSEGHPKYAVDNKQNTIFHTPWGGTDKENFWITLELEEATEIEALRYLSRSGNTNGIVNEYVVEGSMDNETWTELSTGKWENNPLTWSLAEFTEPQKVKYVRLRALSTYGDGNQANKFMSANEIRVRIAEEPVEDFEQLAKEVEVLISNLPEVSELTLADKEDVEAVRAAYEALPEEAKQLVTTLSELELREERIAELEEAIEETEEEAKRAAVLVDRMIYRLPNVRVLTTGDTELIESVRTAYDNLSDQAKTHVKYLSNLELREDRLDILNSEEEVADKFAVRELQRRIYRLPSARNITLADAEQVEAIRAEFDKLNDASKEIFSPQYLKNLELRETKLEELRNQE